MKLLIVLHHRFDLWNAPQWFSAKLAQEFPHVNIVHLPSYDGIDAELRDAEIAITWSLRPEQFALARKLRWIHSPAAAVHQLIFSELVASDVILTNSRDVHGPVVAEHVIAQIFALAKCLPSAVRLQQQHVWGQDAMWGAEPRVREVAGATLGLVGVGSIGREVARKASAFGMHVIACREHPENELPEGVEQVFAASQLDQLLASSDYLVLATPVTPETRHLINASRLTKMKPDAFLINVGRGALVDESALADALRTHSIGGAALDVFSKEPLPPDSALWDCDNLLITPHTAALTDKLWERHYALIAENLHRFLNSKPLLATVDKRRGY